MKMTSTYCLQYCLQLVFFIVLFFGAIQPSYAIELGGVRVEKVVKKSALGRNVIKAWKGPINHPELRVNTDFLKNIENFTDDVITQLNVDLLNPKYTLKELFLESPDDVTNIWEKLKDDPDFHWGQYDNDGFIPDSRWEKWSQREFFKDATAKGTYFEKEFLLPRFKNRSSAEYLQLKTRANEEFGIDLNDYDMYSQVQLKYPTPITLPNGKVIEYFTADQVYVKWVEINGTQVIDDFVVIENKLKSTTNLTTNQNAGKSANSLIVRSSNAINQSPVSGNALPQNTEIDFNDKWLKVYDSDNGDVISGINKL